MEKQFLHSKVLGWLEVGKITKLVNCLERSGSYFDQKKPSLINVVFAIKPITMARNWVPVIKTSQLIFDFLNLRSGSKIECLKKLIRSGICIWDMGLY